MRKQYHILNGDSLKEHFPDTIPGEIIVARECLVDGNVNSSNLAELFQVRAAFISNNYDGYKEQDYFDKTVPEFQKIQDIPEGADINLWFEDDLFCQVNLWFVINLLCKRNQNNQLFLVRPELHNQYGFGGLVQSELISLFEHRLKLIELDTLAQLWEFYQVNDIERLTETSAQLKNLYPFIYTAVQAHIDRIPANGNMGRPSQSLVQIMAELDTTEFGPVFREFCKREPIYGFGDLQVKRLLDELNARG